MILEYKTHRLWGPFKDFDLAHKQLEKWIDEGFVKPKQVTIKPIVETTPETQREIQVSLLRHYEGRDVHIETLDGTNYSGYLYCGGSEYVWVGDQQVALDSIYDVRWRHTAQPKLAQVG
jgi:hypothetical protein